MASPLPTPYEAMVELIMRQPDPRPQLRPARAVPERVDTIGETHRGYDPNLTLAENWRRLAEYEIPGANPEVPTVKDALVGLLLSAGGLPSPIGGQAPKAPAPGGRLKGGTTPEGAAYRAELEAKRAAQKPRKPADPTMSKLKESVDLLNQGIETFGLDPAGRREAASLRADQAKIRDHRLRESSMAVQARKNHPAPPAREPSQPPTDPVILEAMGVRVPKGPELDTASVVRSQLRKRQPRQSQRKQTLEDVIAEAAAAVPSPKAKAKGGRPTVSGHSGQFQGSLEEGRRAARQERYFRGRGTNVSAQLSSPDPAGRLRPGEYVVMTQPGKEPQITHVGPGMTFDKALAQFKQKAKQKDFIEMWGKVGGE